MSEPINNIFSQEENLQIPSIKVKIENYNILKAFTDDLIKASQLTTLGLLDSFIACAHNLHAHFYWTGFYRVVDERLLEVGPSRGTVGCTHIEFGRGVCGEVAQTRQTKIVGDTRLEKNHIACDAASLSEIVLPLISEDQLIAVLDVDSHLPNAFDETDRYWLDIMMETIGKGIENRSKTLF